VIFLCGQLTLTGATPDWTLDEFTCLFDFINKQGVRVYVFCSL
jgi:hypothetical protein